MKTLWRDVPFVSAPGSWEVIQSGVQNLASRDTTYLADLCQKISTMGRNRRMPICIDYMPLSLYDDSVKGTGIRAMYCAVMPMQNKSVDNKFRICFRARPYAGVGKIQETLIDNALRKYIFNYAAISKLLARVDNLNSLQDVKDALQTGLQIFHELLLMSRLFRIPDLVKYSGDSSMTSFATEVLNPVIVKYESAYKSVCNDNAARMSDKVIDLSKRLLKQASVILDEIVRMQDSVLDLAVFVYIIESDALKAAPYIVDLADYNTSEAGVVFAERSTSVQCIDSVGIINIQTASLAILKELRSHSYRLLQERYTQDSKATEALKPIIGEYLNKGVGNDKDIQAMYNRHMFIANYELMQLNQLNHSVYTSNAQNLVGALTEYVPLISKFEGVPNPVFDTEAGVCPWEILRQQGAQGVLAGALYQYSTYVHGQYETFDHMIDVEDSEDFSSLYTVYLPCAIFDALASRASADKLFIAPSKNTFYFGDATKDNTIGYSAYLPAIVMSAMLCSIACIFTSEDGVRLADNKTGVGYYSFDTSSDKSKSIPRSVLADNVFGACGSHVPLNCGEHNIPLSYYDMLLYKALIAAKKMPVGIDVIKRGLDFTRWLNLRPNEVILN